MRPLWLLTLCLPLLGWTQATPETGNAYKQVLEKVQPNIVTVRVVVKVELSQRTRLRPKRASSRCKARFLPATDW